MSQRQRYLCSFCCLILFGVFSSLFLTTSLPLHGRFRGRGSVQHLVFMRSSPLLSNLTLQMTTNVSQVAPVMLSSPRTVTKPISLPSTPSSVTETPVFFEPAPSVVPLLPTDQVESREFEEVRRKCARSSLTPRVVHDSFPYVINEPDLCAGDVFLVIAVHSRLSYHARRQIIRQTWGSVRQYESQRIQIVFFVAATSSKKDQEALLIESRTYRDVVQRDFLEHYRNMTLKHLSVLRWVADYCSHASYLVKVDDDTFVNVFHAIQLLNTRVPRHFMCKVVSGVPVRSTKSAMRKWLVTRREYPYKKYPLYCEGFAYFIDVNHVKELYWCSQFSNFFWIDDIFVTGLVAKKLRILRERLWNGHSWAESVPSLASSKILDYVFVRAGHNEFIPQFWTRLWKATLRYNY